MTVEKVILYSEWIVPFLSLSVLGVAVVVLMTKVFAMYKKFKFFQNLPGLDGFSLVYGNTHHLPKSSEERLQLGISMMERFNQKFHRFWIGPLVPTVMTYHPETVKKILQSSAPKSRGLGSAFELVLPWIGEGLISTNGNRWARSRRLLTPAFHFDILKDYMQVYNEAADNLFKKLDKFAETGESFDIYPLMTLYTLEVILKCSLGYEADVQGSGHPYGRAVTELAQIWTDRARKPWLWVDWIFRFTSAGKTFYKNVDYVHKFAEDVIEQRKQSLDKEGAPKKRRLDFINILLRARDEDGQPMTSLEIRNEVDTFMFAGHDTTASAIPWTLFNLARHPEYQERVQEEVDAILNTRDSDDILWEDMSQLKMLALCGKESMRLYPPVPFIQRELNQDVEFDGHIIPSGTIVNISITALHRNSAVWDEPEEFRPERFLTENKKTMDSFAFVPFSAGSRNCIGQNFALNEEKVTLSRILRRYKVKIAPDHELPKRNAAAILRSENGIWFTLQKRSAQDYSQ